MTEVDLKAVGRRISERRRMLNYTQEQMAEWMNVSIQMISNLERGNKSIRIENLVKVCEILQVSADYLLTGRQGSADRSELTAQMEGLSEEDFRMIRMLIEYCAKKKK